MAHPQKMINLLVKLYRKGMTIDEITSQYDICEMTLRARFKKCGVKFREYNGIMSKERPKYNSY